MIELKRALKAKIDEASEMQIRRDLAEKKLTTANKDADDRVVKLQNEVDELRGKVGKQEREFEETLNHLQSDIESLEMERGELRQRLTMVSKQKIFDNLAKAVPTPSSPFSTNETSLISEIKDVRAALKRVNEENWDLKMRIATKDSNWNASRLIQTSKFKPLWLLRAQGKEAQIDPRQEKLIKLTQQVNELQKEIRLSMITESIWDLKKPIKQQAAEEAMKKMDFVLRYEKLEREIGQFVRESFDGYQVEGHFAQFQQPQLIKNLTSEEASVLARISIPTSEKQADCVSLEVTLEQLRKLHQRLL